MCRPGRDDLVADRVELCRPVQRDRRDPVGTFIEDEIFVRGHRRFLPQVRQSTKTLRGKGRAVNGGPGMGRPASPDEQDDNQDHHQQTQPAGRVVAPTDAVGPGRQRADHQDDQQDQKQKTHGRPPCFLWVEGAARCRPGPTASVGATTRPAGWVCWWWSWLSSCSSGDEGRPMPGPPLTALPFPRKVFVLWRTCGRKRRWPLTKISSSMNVPTGSRRSR